MENPNACCRISQLWQETRKPSIAPRRVRRTSRTPHKAAAADGRATLGREEPQATKAAPGAHLRPATHVENQLAGPLSHGPDAGAPNSDDRRITSARGLSACRHGLDTAE